MELITFIVCDDIRRETENKLSIMGIYDDSIEFLVKPGSENSWPKAMRLGFYIKLGISKGEKIPHAFCLNVIQGGDFKKIAQGNLNKTKNEGLIKITMSLIFGNFKFKDKGKMTFKLELFNNNNDLVQSLEPNYPIDIKEKVIE